MAALTPLASLLAIALLSLSMPAEAAVTTCTPVSVAALDVDSSVYGGSAVLVVPHGACPVTVTSTVYRLSGGEKPPFEEQWLYDTIVYRLVTPSQSAMRRRTVVR